MVQEQSPASATTGLIAVRIIVREPSSAIASSLQRRTSKTIGSFIGRSFKASDEGAIRLNRDIGAGRGPQGRIDLVE